MRVQPLIYCAALMLRLSLPAFSESRGTVEEVVLTHVANAMSVYRIVNGHLPTKWEQIGTIIKLDAENRSLKTAYGFRIQDRYQFVNQKLPLLDPLQSDVLLIRIAPFKDYRANWKLNRTLVYRTKNGLVMEGMVPEEQVQKALRAANFQITGPSDAAEVESNANRSDSATRPPDSSVGPGAVATPTQSPPVASVPPISSRVPTTPVVQAPSPSSEHELALRPWVAGIAALVVIIAAALKRRA